MNTPNLRRISVKPRDGIVVIDPETNQPIPKDGAEVLDNKYVRRRIADKDLIVIEEIAQKNSKKTGNQ